MSSTDTLKNEVQDPGSKPAESVPCYNGTNAGGDRTRLIDHWNVTAAALHSAGSYQSSLCQPQTPGILSFLSTVEWKIGFAQQCICGTEAEKPIVFLHNILCEDLTSKLYLILWILSLGFFFPFLPLLPGQAYMGISSKASKALDFLPKTILPPHQPGKLQPWPFMGLTVHLPCYHLPPEQSASAVKSNKVAKEHCCKLRMSPGLSRATDDMFRNLPPVNLFQLFQKANPHLLHSWQSKFREPILWRKWEAIRCGNNQLSFCYSKVHTNLRMLLLLEEQVFSSPGQSTTCALHAPPSLDPISLQAKYLQPFFLISPQPLRAQYP